MGKSTIPMAIFNSKLLVYQTVHETKKQKRFTLIFHVIAINWDFFYHW